MTTKAKKLAAPEAEKFPRKDVPIYGKTKADGRVYFAKLVTSSELAAHRVINVAEVKSGIGDHIDVPSLLEQLRSQTEAVNRGDLKQVEAMLINQATALQSLFSRLTERGMSCDHLAGFEANMRMALRAQNQCRATLETLATIKNPPIVYAKQANITHGPQQVNNGTAVPSQAGNSENQQSKLSEATYELLENTGTQGIASGVNPALETVGEKHRAKVGRR